jgi:hypothetical protein
MAVRPPLPENLAAGQPSTSHRPISRFTPRIAKKLRGYLGYLLSNLLLKEIAPKRSQSKGIIDLGPLGHEPEQLEKPPNRGRFKGVLGGKVTSQRGTRSSYITPHMNPARNQPQNSATKITRKSSENHQKENGRGNTRP